MGRLPRWISVRTLSLAATGMSLAVPQPSLGSLLERDARLAADVAAAERRAMVRAVPDPSVCTLLDVGAGRTAMALPMIGSLKPFDQPTIETVAGEEIAYHRAPPLVRTGGGQFVF